MVKTNRRGRKRKTTARRQPDGRVSQRSEKQKVEDIVSVVREARQRVFGVAGTMEESTEIGRLLATGEITRKQFDALAEYRRAVERYDDAMKAPALISATEVLSKSIPSDGPSEDVRPRRPFDSEGNSQEYREWVEYAKRAYLACQRALIACHDPLTRSVVDIVALSDLSVPHFIGALRLGANALAHELRLPDASAGQRLDKPEVPEYG